jgi:hypothetical protein
MTTQGKKLKIQEKKFKNPSPKPRTHFEVFGAFTGTRPENARRRREELPSLPAKAP